MGSGSTVRGRHLAAVSPGGRRCYTVPMTMPAPDDDERDARPLGSDTGPTDDDGEASGEAGPSYPPEETEPDAH